MSETDFQILSFIHFKGSDKSKEPLTAEDLEGNTCLLCENGCEGFSTHSWRKFCNSCKCSQELHVKTLNNNEHNEPKDRMCVEEENPPILSGSDLEQAALEGFEWVPRGLDSEQIHQYMSLLPGDKVPKLNSVGAKYRRKQLALQLPLQDFSSKHCKKLTLEQKMAMEDFNEKRLKNALGIGSVRPSITEDATCSKCKDTISAAEMAIFAERAGPEFCWHVPCFVCEEDGELLVDLVYCFKDGALYCPRHWGESQKPRCAGCEELIYVGEYSQAIEKNWHPGHLCCSFCDESLSNQKFVTVEGRPSCFKCYDLNFANTCESCKEPIGPGSKDVDVRNKHWHEDCFKCSQCNKQLLSEGFTFKDEKLICHACRGINPSKVCAHCGGDFAPGEKKVGYQNKTFHDRCFICDECKEPIGSKQFIRRDDKRLCNNCFDSKFAKVCFKCKEVIRTSSVQHSGNVYHSECFICYHCNNPLAGKPFTKQEGNNVCQDCYRERYAKRCAACDKLIEGNTKFVAYSEKYFHRDCFTCSKCEKPLAGEKFRIRDEQKVCLSCDE
ncbi:testin-like [Actinia tenebrosa]|uniref:Testin-like n=1 Tax=Actinia tenebrosa TaxID=6105 RepID=A0A6P8IHD7_ACTTE|nr:testin-like [Actinia tenebrosa]